MDRQKNIASLCDVPIETIESPESFCFGGKRQRVGQAIGAKKLGYRVFAVPPGKAAFAFHTHYTNRMRPTATRAG